MKFSYSVLLETLFLAVSAVDVAPSDSLPLSASTQPGAVDGIWTGNDWENTTENIGVKNGLPYGVTDSMNRKI